MKTRITFIQLLGLLAMALLFGACQPCDDPTDPECPNYCQDVTNPECPNYCQDPSDWRCPNYDPCFGKEPLSASFQIFETPAIRVQDSMGFEYHDTDTAMNRIITLQADDQEALEYEWQVGSDIYTEPTVQVIFTTIEDRLPIDIPIRLIIRQYPSTACFPDDTGLDTVERTLHIVQQCEAGWKGFYQGHIEGENPTDTFTVGIAPKSDDWNPDSTSCDGLRLINWDRQGCDWVARMGFNSYRYVNGGGGTSCEYWLGYVWLNPKGDSIRASYRKIVGRNPDGRAIFEDRVFIGKRVK